MKDNQFYPTPWEVAERAAGLLQGSAGLLLEPSAGHGDLLKQLQYRHNGIDRNFKIKCVEIDPDNVAVLRAAGYETLQADFLAVQLPRIFDAVLMNPPFNAGAKHILKAWQLLKQGGELVAVINRSALDNDFSADRQLLNTLIEKNGEIIDIGRAFEGSSAERKAAVECSIIYMRRHEYEDDNIDTTEGLSKGPEMRIEPDQVQEYGLIKADFISAAEEDYQRGIAEVFKGMESIEKGWKILNARFGSAYDQNVKRLDDVFNSTMENIASRSEEGKALATIKEEFVAGVRTLSWLTVLDKTEVEKLLYSNDRDAFISQIMTDSRGISFTKKNIVGFVHNIFMKRNEIFTGAVKKLFIELRRYHDNNSCHTEGWKTNKSWKVPEKIILPYGVRFEYGRFSTNYRQDYLDDLDRIVRVLDAKPADFGKTIKQHLQDAIFAACEGKRVYSDEIETPYFVLKYFKKGTLHITFKKEAEEIRNRINIIGADGCNDIPDMNQ